MLTQAELTEILTGKNTHYFFCFSYFSCNFFSLFLFPFLFSFFLPIFSFYSFYYSFHLGLFMNFVKHIHNGRQIIFMKCWLNHASQLLALSSLVYIYCVTEMSVFQGHKIRLRYSCRKEDVKQNGILILSLKRDQHVFWLSVDIVQNNFILAK